MSEIQRSEIIYEEGWHEAAPLMETQIPLDEIEPKEEEKVEPRETSRPLLITLQLVLCLLAALVLFLLKAMDSGFYHDFMDYYHEELNKPVVSQDVFGAMDISRLFANDTVTVQATPDETANSR